MRILLINQYAGSPKLGMEFRPHWMAREWLAQGHQVRIVAGDQSHLRAVPLEAGRYDVEGVDYTVLRTTKYEGNSPARLANLLSFHAQLFRNKKRLAAWNPDVVIASSTNTMDVRPAVAIARRAGARFVYEVHDLWPLTPQLLGGMSTRHPMIMVMQREENYGYRNANHVVSLLPNTENYMRSHGLRPGRWTYVPNGVAAIGAELPAPTDYVEAIAELREKYPTILGYAGTHGLANDLPALLDQAGHCAKLGLAFVFVGAGPDRPQLIEKYAGEPNLLFLPRIERDRVRAVMQLWDAGYVGGRPSPLYEHGISPNKVSEYMAAGIPIVENVGAAKSPTQAADCGWVCNPTDRMDLRRALDDLATCSAARRLELGSSGQKFAQANLIHEVLADRMIAAMSRS